MLGVQLSGASEIAGEVNFDAAMVGTEVERQFPLAVDGAEHVGQVALDAVLPDVFFQGGEKLAAALGAAADQAGELAENGAFEKGLGDGAELAGAVEEHLH